MGGAEKAGLADGRGGGVCLGEELMLRPAMSGCSARVGEVVPSLTVCSSFPFKAATVLQVNIS